MLLQNEIALMERKTKALLSLNDSINGVLNVLKDFPELKGVVEKTLGIQINLPTEKTRKHGKWGEAEIHRLYDILIEKFPKNEFYSKDIIAAMGVVQNKKYSDGAIGRVLPFFTLVRKEHKNPNTNRFITVHAVPQDYITQKETSNV